MAKKEKTSCSELLEALNFINLAQKRESTSANKVTNPLFTHCNISNNFVIGTDGIITAGHKIKEDITAKPNTLKLIQALETCVSSDVSIVQLDNSLSIKSGKFKAFVQCLFDPLPVSYPDYPCGIIDNRLKTGFKTIEFLSDEKAKDLVAGTLLLNAYSMFSTNKFLILEYYHAIDLPNGLVIPLCFVNAVCKSNKNLAKFGFSNRSLTFWFEDNSWIKTQLYEENWPPLDKILNVPTNPVALYPGFYNAIEAVAPFTGKSESVYFEKDLLKSNNSDNEGASFEVVGLPEERAFNYKFLKMIKPFTNKVDFTTYFDRVFFFGENVRGCLMGMRIEKKTPKFEKPASTTKVDYNVNTDDIPF